MEGDKPTENGDAPESDQGQQDGLLSQDQEELSERVSHLEKRVREQEDEIVCLKGALADVTRRLGQVETAKSAQNSILPSRPFKSSSSRRATMGQERPKSQVLESSNFTPRSSGPPTSARPAPRGASASSMKKWGSTEDTRGHTKTPRPHTSSQLNHSNIKEPTWNEEDKYLRMHLKGRPVALFASVNTENYDVSAPLHPPEQQLQLEWVYGYRGRDCRNNLYVLGTGEVVYFHAAAVILHNIESQSQRFYLEHTDDIKCIAVHPDQIKVATGQVAGHEKKDGKPHIRIWESIGLTTLIVIGETDNSHGLNDSPFKRGVCCVAFSKVDAGATLLAVDESNEHTLSVWDIRKDKAVKIAESKSSGDPVTQCEFHPLEENSIVCCGKSQITFWTYDTKDRKLDKKSGIFEKNEKAKVIICFAFATNGDVISGDSSGNIYVWPKGSNKISKALPNAHKDGVFSLYVDEQGFLLSGGGKDRKVIQWDDSYKKTGTETEIPENIGGVRMISKGPGNGIVVGTIRNCILLGNMELGISPVVEGHKEELWGLDTSPSCLQFLTCGYDRHIYLWDAATHACVWKMEIAESAHCCTIHPVLDIAAIGCQNGEWLVLHLTSRQIVAVYTDGKEQHECIQYSPDGNKIAVGCRDNYIYVYAVEEEGKKNHLIGRCSGHSSFITHIDWSVDGKFLRSNSGDYEVLYWNTCTCKQETKKDEVRETDWATQNCTLSFNSVGVWPDEADGTDVNNCCVSHNRNLLASADDYGKVNLYKFPSDQHKATGHSYPGHSSHVTMVKFLCDDSRLISTGGRDTAIMQWQVLQSD
ncbi:Echinoderm microtubule-associated protein-like 1 [Mactra antiquata]